ncbi:hypothetical protein [Ralstonia solanacearum]|uniref:hypothetical protein n=1 Tax=Ralstonia solanacearum TaxID=305 RepID=UPI001FF95E86
MKKEDGFVMMVGGNCSVAVPPPKFEKPAFALAFLFGVRTRSHPNFCPIWNGCVATNLPHQKWQGLYGNHPTTRQILGSPDSTKGLAAAFTKLHDKD